jgi:hypothetical protein
MSEKPSSSGQITLDQLVASASQSALRALEEHQRQAPGGLKINPRIWVGIWIDPLGGIETLPGTVAGGRQQ